MFQEKFVTAVKHNGRVLREQGDTVLLPFGAEFSLFFKNLNSLRALVRVSIDGTDATEGTSLIVPANGSIDLERFIKNGNLSAGNKFKFIERTQKIEDGPRGIKADDGLVRVEFEFERQAPKVEYETIRRTITDDYWRNPYRIYSQGNQLWATTADAAPTKSTKSVFRGGAGGSSTASYSASASASELSVTQNAAQSLAGITVPGSESKQEFSVGQWFATDGQKHVMVLRLAGQVGEQVVERPVTVKTQQVCPTCGTKNKHGTKFCKECGTALSLV